MYFFSIWLCFFTVVVLLCGLFVSFGKTGFLSVTHLGAHWRSPSLGTVVAKGARVGPCGEEVVASRPRAHGAEPTPPATACVCY